MAVQDLRRKNILRKWTENWNFSFDIESESIGGPEPVEETINYEVDIEYKSKSEFDTEGKSLMIKLT